MSEILRGGNTEYLHLRLLKRVAAQRTRLRGNAPVAVLIAGSAIVATRCLGMLMLTNSLGVEGVRSFIDTSSRSWDLTLLFLASLTVLFVELRCGFAVMRGLGWSRWYFVVCQGLSAGYLFLATWNGFYPEMFALSGNSAAEIAGELLMHKLPDIVIMLLLFAPLSSRRFFKRGR
ncbi:YbjO family protein [Acerihabitans sp.]|uniref:YbjO family protein n=1 Tax=Acerihabitans sp. TaxID=2811394 RepID=UPI002ED99B79